MSATYMHLKEVQWQLETDEAGYISGVINHDNETWRPNDVVTWVDFKEDIERTRIRMLWAQASKHRGGPNMEKESTYRLLKSIIKGLVKQESTAKLVH